METLISDLKKVMNSDIENKDKYMKMLINGFLRERDSELLTIQGVVKSLKRKETPTFEEWKKANYFHWEKNMFVRKQEGLKSLEQLKQIYNTEILNL